MEICFTHRSLFQKQNEAKVCNFGDGVLFCAEVMHRGRGNVMLAFSHLGCCVSFLSEQLFARKAVWWPLFVWSSKRNSSTGYCNAATCYVINILHQVRMTNLMAFCDGLQHQWVKEEQLMSPTWTCAKHLALSHVIARSPKWRKMDLMDGALAG